MSGSHASDPNYPDLIYPHRERGYDWEPRGSRLPEPRLHGPDPSGELLLAIAKAAYQEREIRENFLAEASYPGGLLDDGKFPVHPGVAANMLDAFYAAHAQRQGRPKDYTLGGIWRLTQLVRAWASGALEMDDDSTALAWLTPENQAPPHSRPVSPVWRHIRLWAIVLLLVILALLSLGIVEPQHVLPLR